MNSFSEYMDQIKASPELKMRTEAYVISEIKKQKSFPQPVFIRKKARAKKFLIAVVSTAACLILTLGGYSFYNMPINYVCIDINPSVELGVNIFDKVVNAEAYNEDGSRLLGDNEQDIKFLQINKAVDVIISYAAEQGYIAKDGSTVIALTTESKRGETDLKLSDKCEDGLNTALSTDNISAVVYTDCSDIEFRSKAKEAGVSPGKYKLISILQSLDPDITIDDYKSAKVTDIITQVDEITMQLEQAGQPGTQTAALEKIQAAARKVKQIQGNKSNEENKDRSSESSEKEHMKNSADNQSNQDSDNRKKHKDTVEVSTAPEQNDIKAGGKDKVKGNQGITNSREHEGKGKESSTKKKTG